MTLFLLIIIINYTLSINGTLRYLSISGGWKNNIYYLVMMFFPIANIISNIMISKSIKQELETSGVRVGIFGAGNQKVSN